MKDKEIIKLIFKIVKSTEKEIKQIYDDGTLEKPIQNDIVLSKRNMAYNEIKAKLKIYKREKERENDE